MQPSGSLELPNGATRDMQERFKTALEEMAQADAEENDDLPDPLFMFSSQGSRVVEMDPPPLYQSVSLSPEEQGFDEMLTIPGEPVFARSVRDQGVTTEYWPARVLRWLPSSNLSKRGKYELQFFDGKPVQVDRTWFFTYFEGGFSKCRVSELPSRSYRLSHQYQ